MIKGMNHVGVSVANLDRSIEFYRILLGMQIVSEGTFSGNLYESILGLRAATGRSATLSSGHMRIELFEFSHPSPKTAAPDRPVCDHGITHFCIEVGDIISEYERLRAAGVAFHCPPLDFGTAKATYGRDPDGNVFELLELQE